MSNRTKKSKIRKTFRATAWLLAVIYLLYVVAGFWLAPSMIKARLTEQVQQSIGGTFSVKKISFNPFTLKLKLDQLMLTDDSQAKWLTANSIEVNMDIIDLFSDVITVSSITTNKPMVFVQLDSDGSLTHPTLSLETNASDQTVKFLLQKLMVNNGTLKLQHGDSPPLTAQNISLQFNNLSNQNLFSSGSFELNLAEDGLLKFTTNTQQDGTYGMYFEGNNIPVGLFNTWLTDTSIKLNKGTLNTSGQVNWTAG